jgi:hypothetical protein
VLVIRGDTVTNTAPADTAANEGLDTPSAPSVESAAPVLPRDGLVGDTREVEAIVASGANVAGELDPALKVIIEKIDAALETAKAGLSSVKDALGALVVHAGGPVATPPSASAAPSPPVPPSANPDTSTYIYGGNQDQAGTDGWFNSGLVTKDDEPVYLWTGPAGSAPAGGDYKVYRGPLSAPMGDVPTAAAPAPEAAPAPTPAEQVAATGTTVSTATGVANVLTSDTPLLDAQGNTVGYHRVDGTFYTV